CPLFCCTLRRLRRPPPFPYTTLFRSTIALAVTAFGIAGCSSGGSKRSSSSTIVPSQPGGPGGPGGGNGPGTNPGDNTPNKGNLEDRKSTRLNSSHVKISYAVFCLKKK